MKQQLINSIPFLSELSEDNKERIKEVLIEKKMKKGTVLFVEHSPADTIYFVRKGKVRLSKSSSEGKELVLGIRKSGELFGQVALFRKDTYPATAVMLEDGELVMIRNSDLENMILKYPEIGVSIIRIMGERLHEAQTKLRDVALYGKLGALASTLIRLSKDYGTTTSDGIQIELSLTHQELANFIGAARENVNRMMSMLEKSGVLNMSRGTIVIKSMEELKSYID